MTTDLPHTDTAVLPAVRPGNLPAPGTYHASTGRCILEISAAAGPLTTLRGRLAVLSNTLNVAEDGADPDEASSLRLEASSGSLRTTRPLAARHVLGRRGLDARQHETIRFESSAIEVVDRMSLRIPGNLYLRGNPVGVRLQTRIVKREESRLLLIATAQLTRQALLDACAFRLPWSVPASRVRVLFAADFR